MGLSKGVEVTIWLRRVLERLNVVQQQTEIVQDNSGSVTLATEHLPED